MICFAQLNLNSSEQIKKELEHFSANWTPHFNTFHYQGEWTALSLRSPGGKNQIIPDLVGEEQYADTETMQNFPSVKHLINSLQCPVMSARFLNLKVGAIIKPHRDAELAFEKGEARLHFPIFTNTEVEFYVEEDKVQMNEGQCWYINANLTHRVSNHGTSDRIHLVIDCKVNDWLKLVFAEADKKCKVNEKDIQQQKQIIEALRMQNTETTLKLADKLEYELNNG